MRQPINQRCPRVLWSEIFALWRDHARRPALPLLLAMLLFVSAPFTATADCSSEMDGYSHEASASHAHGAAEMADDHYAHDAAPQATASQGATLQAPANCCSCSSEPLTATVATISAPHHPKADSHALVYAVADASPIYRAEAPESLHTRAGPPNGKPQGLSLASLIGRAPPVSL